MCSSLLHWHIGQYIILGCLYMSVISLNSLQYESGNAFSNNWRHEFWPVTGNSSRNISPIPFSSSNHFVSCEDLGGVGSFNTTCLLNTNLSLYSDFYISGTGNLEILPHVVICCPIEGCTITLNMSGNIKVSQHAGVVAGSVVFSAANVTMEYNSYINTTALGGAPPPQTSGTPVGYDGSGGGHGGRGATCLKGNQTSNWGGDVYAWSTLSEPWSYGSKGGGISDENPYGGLGGGRVKLLIVGVLYLNGSILAEGGDGGSRGGGGSGGSIFVHAVKLKGSGTISAAGGKGWGGGGGGRISLDCYSIQEDIKVTVHGGVSIGCSGNAGAAGTYFNADLLSLRVGNDNLTTETETPLLDFSTSPLWSNVFVENNAKALVPLLWTRVQVRGQITLYCGGSIVFGLSEFPISEFELVAEELLMSDSVIMVFGALRVFVKMLLMWNSKIMVDGGRNTFVTASVLEVRNLVVLKQNSSISSNSNLGMYGQGLLHLIGQGDTIKGQRLSLSLFYNITVGSGSLLQAPLDDDDSRSLVTKAMCDSETCPLDLLTPPDDCHFNYTLSFSLQICRVEDLIVNGIIEGSIIQIHRARTVIVNSNGMITASELGCDEGIGKGNYSNGAGSGAGHGGRGGSGYFNGWVSNGGDEYGNADLPCELGSGAQGPDHFDTSVAGGGMIVMGSIQWPLLTLKIFGSLTADGQSFVKVTRNDNSSLIGGHGGGSGGTILLFLQELELFRNSSITAIGGNGGSLGGGGGGGGRVHFHWSNIHGGDKYTPVASISGSINSRNALLALTKMLRGLMQIFAFLVLLTFCPIVQISYILEMSTPMTGGVDQPFCPYKCISEKYRMPNCFTPLEELMYTFGGPWPFSVILSCFLVLLALLLSTLRVKFVGYGSYRDADAIEPHSHRHFPHLLSLSEVRGTRAEETQSHVYRMYFMGPNTFREPWHLPYSPPNAIIEIVYEDAFNRFIDEINSVAAYHWWEGSVHSILSILAYPCAWTWKQWRRRHKIHRLQDYVKSEYDHSCLRSCRSRALYKGMKVGATPDLMVAYIDFFLGGDEKRLDIVSIIEKRYPMCIIFGGDGSYMTPYNLHSDALLTNLIGQHVPATVWNRLVAGMNAQLRIVRNRSICSSLIPVIDWINSHANPQLEFHGVKIEVGWFQATASGYYQLGVLVVAFGDYSSHQLERSDMLCQHTNEPSREDAASSTESLTQFDQNWQSLSLKKITGVVNGGLINKANVGLLHYRWDFLYPFSLLLRNRKPIGHLDTVQLLITIVLLADISITLLMLLQFYWISLVAFLLVLLVLPLSLLCPFPAGLNALFSKEPRRASLARIYALWNATSLANIGVAFIYAVFLYVFSTFQPPNETNTWSNRRETEKWWIMPVILLIFKSAQAQLVDWHIANLEMKDISLFCPDPDAFWAAEFA
ncbi:uncharacterized protein LOC120078090 isoform X2 [Benincasa hispida]|uniref:uncharacterized protein LOC120078090 isoform X2 n=1 Tax=Benincasa hispida TaxID=102211 RepID=UPI001902BCDF|nr:uncharacterized protein LOC120078090 isoform X2 [Benincasa hispida]